MIVYIESLEVHRRDNRVTEEKKEQMKKYLLRTLTWETFSVSVCTSSPLLLRTFIDFPTFLSLSFYNRSLKQTPLFITLPRWKIPQSTDWLKSAAMSSVIG